MTLELRDSNNTVIWKGNQFVFGFKMARLSIIAGIIHHYPICCIVRFAVDVFLIKSPIERGITKEGYVPCFFHKKVNNW